MSACCLTLFAGSCSDETTDAPVKPDPAAPTITVEGVPEGGYNFAYVSLSQKFTMTCDAKWVITKNTGWIVVSPKEGRAGENFEITLTSDDNTGAEREGEITITANSGTVLHPCLTTHTIKVSQKLYTGAEFDVEGVEDDKITFEAADVDPVKFKVRGSFDWTLAVDDESWVTVAPKSGKAGQQVEVTVTPKAANTSPEANEAVINMVCFDPEHTSNSASMQINLSQEGYRKIDSHAVGYEFFKDDFSWTTDNWNNKYTRYGWPSVAIDGTNNNEFSIITTAATKAAVDQIGYSYSAANSVYARYEGCLKFGKTNVHDWLTTPAFDQIDADAVAVLELSFDASLYSSAGGTVDSALTALDVTIVGDGTFEDDTTAKQIELSGVVWYWKRFYLIIKDATASTRIKFGSDQTKTGRMYLDNISVKRAAKNAVASAAHEVVIPLDKEIIATSLTGVPAAGGAQTCSIRVNRAWTATPKDSWITTTKVACGAAANGGKVTDGVGTATKTELPYNNTVFTVEANTGAARTGTIEISADGGVIHTITVTQDGI